MRTKSLQLEAGLPPSLPFCRHLPSPPLPSPSPPPLPPFPPIHASLPLPPSPPRRALLCDDRVCALIDARRRGVMAKLPKLRSPIVVVNASLRKPVKAMTSCPKLPKLFGNLREFVSSSMPLSEGHLRN